MRPHELERYAKEPRPVMRRTLADSPGVRSCLTQPAERPSLCRDDARAHELLVLRLCGAHPYALVGVPSPASAG